MKKFLLIAGLGITANAGIAQIQNYSVGQTVANFTVTDLEGHTHTLYSHTAAGKYVLLDFYAYWCGPCCSTAPIIKDFYLKYGCNAGDVVVLGLEGDGTTAQTETFETDCLAGAPNTYPTASGLDGGADAVHTVYNPAAYPTICLIDPTNKIINVDIWPVSTVANLEAAFPSGSITPMACATSVQALLNENSMAVYPSPASQTVTLALNLPQSASIDVTVLNAIGEEVLTYAAGTAATLNKNIDISGLSNGSYFMRVKLNNGETKTMKFMVANF